MDSDPERQSCILFVDAYDSFSENIIALLRQLLHATVVSVKINQPVAALASTWPHLPLPYFDAIVIGPGPGSPDTASDTGYLEQIWELATKLGLPVLGICLGFQSLCTRFGLPVTRLDFPCHGHAKRLLHRDEDIFKGIGDVVATSYNSLGVRMPRPTDTSTSASSSSSINGSSRSSSSCSSLKLDTRRTWDSNADGFESICPLEVLAWNEDSYVMAVKHTDLPFWGLQCHPESCLSNVACQTLITNWWTRVHRHNQKFRLMIKAPPERHLAVQGSEDTNSATKVQSILQCLEMLTHHRAEKVSHTCFNTAVNRAQLSYLCQSLSPEGATAMLESSRRGRFSIYAFTDQHTWLVRQSGDACHIGHRCDVQRTICTEINTTMEAIESLMSQRLMSGGDPNIPFWGGLLGFISYEAGLELAMPEQYKPAMSRLLRRVPDLNMMWVDRSVVFDNETGALHIQTLRSNDSAWLSEMSAKIKAFTANCSIELPYPSLDADLLPFTTDMPSHANYISSIRSCQAQLHAGNSYELCLTTSATVIAPLRSTSTSQEIYRYLQHHNPAPYSAYLSLSTATILSSSPEQFLSWSRSSPHLDMLPMKGTLAKSSNLTRQQARDKLSTPKEEAENLMIADLIRHDLHRSLAPDGNVEVKSLYELVETENTYQLISHIRGHMPLPECKQDLQTPEQQREHSEQIMHYGHKALRTSLPPGSMTGAPKIRSCSILSELEQRNRGVYSGVIGYFDVGGGGCWSVAIRCAFSDKSEDDNRGGQRKWHIGAGGAITVLSDEEEEWEEMRVKMDGVLKGFGVDVATSI